MALIKAKCTVCGADIMTDNSRDAAICPFCMEPYVVEKAIRKYGYSESELQRLLPKDEETANEASTAMDRGNSRNSNAVVDPGGKKIKPAAGALHEEASGTVPAEATEAEEELIRRVLRAVMGNEERVVDGLFRLAMKKDVEALDGFEAEDGVRKELSGALDGSLLTPSESGTGLAELLQEYANKYIHFDILKNGINGDVIVGHLRERLEKEGIKVSEIRIKPLTMNRCEWYEVKEFFGMKARKEKKLVSKEIKALYISCEKESVLSKRLS